MNLFNFDFLRKRDPEQELREMFSPFGWGRNAGQKQSDHGERTNRKLNDQPFYHRGSNGKMRKH